MIILLVADSLVAANFSEFFTKSLLETVNRHSTSRISFKEVRIHPLFLSISARDLEVFDVDHPEIRILSSRRARGHWDLGALLQGKHFLADARFYSTELRVIKDSHGVLNIEKMISKRNDASGVSFYGWEQQDWLFNFYERLKHAVSAKDEAGVSNQKEPGHKLVFRIGKAIFHDGRVILTDRTSKPLIFRQVEISAHAVEWYLPEGVSMRSLMTHGFFKSSINGPFSVTVRRTPTHVDVLAVTSNLDLGALKSIYQKSSQVLFEKGILKMRSHTVITANSLHSDNDLKISEFRMKPTVGWSPQSQTVVNAFNAHHDLPIRFTIEGDPRRPEFHGIEDSLINVLKHDFDRVTLYYIRKRIKIEVDGMAKRLAV